MIFFKLMNRDSNLDSEGFKDIRLTKCATLNHLLAAQYVPNLIRPGVIGKDRGIPFSLTGYKIH